MQYMRVRSEGGHGGLAPQLGKIPKICSKWPFLEKFSQRVYIMSTFSKFAPQLARAREKKIYFEISASPPAGLATGL